jgi:hypothetical protein
MPGNSDDILVEFQTIFWFEIQPIRITLSEACRENRSMCRENSHTIVRHIILIRGVRNLKGKKKTINLLIFAY